MALTKTPIELSSTQGIVDNSNATAITIDSSENVGIGTASPTHTLNTVGASGTSVVQSIRNPNTSWSQYALTRYGTEAADFRYMDFGYYRGATEVTRGLVIKSQADATLVTFLDSGNVGIGISNPSDYYTNFNSLVLGNTSTHSGMTIASGTSHDGTLAFADGTSGTAEYSGYIQYSHGTDSLSVGTAATERMRIDSSGNVIVGTTNLAPVSNNVQGVSIRSFGELQSSRDGAATLYLNRKTNDGDIVILRKDGADVGSIGSDSGANLTIGTGDTGIYFNAGADAVHPWNIGTNAARSGAIDLGRSDDKFKDLYITGLDVTYSTYNKISSYFSGSYTSGFKFSDMNGGIWYDAASDDLTVSASHANSQLILESGGSESARIDASGNLLVGTTDTDPSNNGAGGDAGHAIAGTGYIASARSGDTVALFNRMDNDGNIVDFRKNGSIVGSIGTSNGYPYLQSQGSAGLTMFAYIQPRWNNAAADNAIDLGSGSFRFDDVFATNGTIQTSDRNEKQDIAELSDAEQRVAVAAKGLLRKFRWKDSVAEKGDDARTHFGIIAQDLQAAFAAEGLDAGDYAMFTSTTWTDEETNEEKTRMGVRYSELLAFIISAI